MNNCDCVSFQAPKPDTDPHDSGPEVFHDLEYLGLWDADSLSRVLGLVAEETHPLMSGSCNLRLMRQNRLFFLGPCVADVDVEVSAKIVAGVIPIAPIHQQALDMAAAV